MLRLTKACTAALLALASLLCADPAAANSNDPVVLVHGALGFGPDTIPGNNFLYWGGYHSIAALLQTYHGPHTVFTAAVGPIASNWDRAAELYAQIKGGCVDYGATHVVKHGYPGEVQKPPGKCWAADPARNPEHYPLAFYPQWDARHPIHMIGHSQGGTTIRALIQLLEHGSPDGDEGGGELYRGGKTGWVRSVVTLSAPHKGTTFSDAVINVLPELRNRWRDLIDGHLQQWDLSPD